MPAKKDAAATLAEKMISLLEAQRSSAAQDYPLSLRRLASLTDASADPVSVQKAAAKRKPYGDRVIAVRAKDIDSPVALVEDASLLAASSLTLQYLLNIQCNSVTPTTDLTRLKKAVAPKLRPSFAAACERRIRAGDLPPGVSVHPDRNKTLLYLDAYPPPPRPEAVLADELVRVLQGQKRLGGDSYPLTLARLMELTRPVASAELVKEALALPAFADRVVAGLVTDKKKFRFDSPIALADDDVTLADWPPLIEAALTLARTDAKQAVTVVDLKKKVFPTVADAFMTALDRRLRSNLLPPKVGALLQKKDSYILFFLSDVLGSRLPRAQQFSPEATPADRRTAPSLSFETEFTRMFDDAFDRLERQRGHNFVSLVDLRRAVPVDRQTFDAGLQSMRRAGRYSLSAAEGRDGVTPEEQAAGIRDDGSLLLYVSRRLP